MNESHPCRHVTLLVMLVAFAITVFLMARGCDKSSIAIKLDPAKPVADHGLTEIPRQLTIASSQKILTLDPDLAADGYSEGIVHLIGGTLYEVANNGTVDPVLAASKSVSSDGLTWTFELKSGLKFSDGTALTAADVKATFDRAKGDKQSAYIGVIAPIERIDAASPTQIVLHLLRPYPSLPVVLSQPEMTILPAKGPVENRSFFEAPVSAGQYKLQSWGGSSTAVLVRNPQYAGTPPAIEKLTFQTIDDFNARFAQVQSGQVDLATDIPPRLLANPPGNIVARLTPRYGFITLPLNVGRAPLDEVGVREAIAKAIDRKQLNRTVWNGQIIPIVSFWPSTMSGYDSSRSLDRNVNAAKTDLKGTSCERGCTLHFMYSPVNPWSEPTATVVAQNLKDIGITVKMEKVDDATFNKRLAAIDFQIAVSFVYDYNDVPDGLLTYTMTADGGLHANFTGFKPGVDIEDAVKNALTKDGAARTEALAEINRLFLKYRPFVTLSDYAVGSISRYAPSVVRTDAAGFVAVARRRE